MERYILSNLERMFGNKNLYFINDTLNNNNRRDVKTRADQVMYHGKKYRRDAKTGYMVCTSGERRRLHDVMWETESRAGERIPEGYVVHHKDWDKSHNKIDNLIMITVQEHNLIHNPPREPNDEERAILEKLKRLGLI